MTRVRIWFTTILLVFVMCPFGSAREAGHNGASIKLFTNKPVDYSIPADMIDLITRKAGKLHKVLCNNPLITGFIISEHKGIAPTGFDTIEEVDKLWMQPGGLSVFKRQLLTNKVAVVLHEFQDDEAGFMEIFISDMDGGVVAMTNVTSDYYQADEEWYQKAIQMGQDEIHLGGVHFDESVKGDIVTVCVNVHGDDGELLGVVKANLNLKALALEQPDD